MLISISAKEPSTKTQILLPVGRSDSSIANIPISSRTLKAFSEVVFCHFEDASLLLPLRKVGLYKTEDIVKSANAILKASKLGEETFVSKELIEKVRVVFDKNLSIQTQRITRRWGSIRGKTLTKATSAVVKQVTTEIVSAYSFVALKLCSALALPPKSVNAIAYYLICGTSGGGVVPKAVKALFTGSASSPASSEITIDFLKVTKAHIKKYGRDLVAHLPDMYDRYLTECRDAAPAKDRKVKQRRYVGNGRYQVVTRTIKGKAPLLSVIRGRQDKVILEAIGEEMYQFFKLVIPKFGKPSAKKLQSSEMLAYRRKLRTLMWAVMACKRGLSIASTPARQAAAQKRLDAAQKRLKTFKAGTKPEAPAAKPIAAWMAPYVGAHVSIDVTDGTGSRKVKVNVEDGIMLHRLVQRANMQKLTPKSVELGAILDETNASMLTVAGVDNIVAAFEGDSVKAFQTVFKDCVEQVKVKAFTAAISDRFGQGFETDLGKITNKRLLRLNALTEDDAATFKVQYAAELKSWNPLKETAKSVVDTLSKSDKTKQSAYKVTAATAAQLRDWRAELDSRIWGGHGVKCTLLKAWSLGATPMLKALMKNTKNSKMQVIEDVYHGTSQQTGSVILHCGFKVRGTQVTGRSMGDVLYLAPNLDKSAQYVGGRGVNHRGKGLVFVGDIVVSGKSVSRLNTSRTGFAWTKTCSFKTEEIGVANPNKQFIIRRAYLIKVESGSKTDNAAVAKFKTPVTVAAYLAKHKV